MKSKLIPYLLIALGVLDIYMWFDTRVGWTNQVFGNNILSQYGWGLMIAGGIHLLRKAKAKDKVLLDNIDMEENENIIHQENGSVAIIILSNRKLRFYGFSDMSNLRNTIPNFPEFDEIAYNLNEVISVRPIMLKEVAWAGKWIPMKWGIQIQLDSNQIINLPISNSELLAKLCNKEIKISKNGNSKI